jgi:hypothetical protein
MVQNQAPRNFDGSTVNADAYHNSFKHSALWKQARAVLNARERLTLSDGNHLPHYFFGVECTSDAESFDVTIAQYEALHAEALCIDDAMQEVAFEKRMSEFENVCIRTADFDAVNANAIEEADAQADIIAAMYAAQDDDVVEPMPAYADDDMDRMMYQHRHDAKVARRARRSNADRRDRKEAHSRWLFDRLPIDVQVHELDRKRYMRIIEKSNRRPARAYQATGAYLRSE